MASRIAHFPAVRDLDGFDIAAQPSLDPTAWVVPATLAIRRGDHGHHGENCLTVLPFPAALRRQLFWAIPGEPGEGTLLPESFDYGACTVDTNRRK